MYSQYLRIYLSRPPLKWPRLYHWSPALLPGGAVEVSYGERVAPGSNGRGGRRLLSLPHPPAMRLAAAGSVSGSYQSMRYPARPLNLALLLTTSMLPSSPPPSPPLPPCVVPLTHAAP